MEEGIHIALRPEVLGHLWGLPITNTLLTAWVVAALLIMVGTLVGKHVALVPGKTQTLFEMLFCGVLDYMAETLESRKLAERFFPLIMTLFLFILFANLLGLIPGIGSIGFHTEGEHAGLKSLLYPVNTDLNVTLALAVIVFFIIEMSGIVALGFLKYTSKFVTFTSPLAFFVGVIELFSEIARLVSFSFRLFGNIFAGKVLILVVMFFIPLLVPVPFLMFEVLVGVIQAAIFSLLTLFFIKIAITEGEH